MLTLAFAQDFLLEPEFESVTCGSVIKLSNKLTGYRLHSHEVEYGSGSGQQSVTGFLTGNDPNSYFVIQGKQSTRCVRGTSIQCGEVITLKHQNTGKYLHSHIIPSPISNQQEVSAHDSNDSGDNWKIGCSTNVWKRESAVTIQHVDTSKYLSMNTKYQFGHPISGQLEIAGTTRITDGEHWIAQEGIYLSSEK